LGTNEKITGRIFQISEKLPVGFIFDLKNIIYISCDLNLGGRHEGFDNQ
jgi:hypothetical protein